MAGKTKPGSALKGINIKLKMINDLMDVTGSAKDSWNPAEISDDMKAIAYIHRLADTWNPAQLNEALKYLGFATIDSWNPAIIEETKNKLVKYFLPTEAAGNPITFKTYGNLPYEVSKAEVTFLPKQDLHGYDSPWVGGAGKNKFKNTATSETINGVTFTVNSDGTVTANGTATDIAVFTLASAYDIADGTYLFNGGVNGKCYLYFGYFASDEAESATYVGFYNGDVQFTSHKGTLRYIQCVVLDGYTANNVVFKPMIRLSTVSDGTFAPYENICPISGRTEVNLYLDEEQTLSPANTYTESLGSTYYGGKVDFVSGEGLEEWDYIASYDGETLPGEWISDRDVYAPGTTPATGAEVAYKLSEAVEVTLTPTEIELLKGQNVIWTDGDNIVIKYKALLNS